MQPGDVVEAVGLGRLTNHIVSDPLPVSGRGD
jgi:hypothetical protein